MSCQPTGVGQEELGSKGTSSSVWRILDPTFQNALLLLRATWDGSHFLPHTFLRFGDVGNQKTDSCGD